MSKKSGWQDPQDAARNNPFAAALAARLPAAPTPPSAEPTPSAPPAPVAPKAPARAVVRLERKGRGGKTVTTVSHLGLPADAMEAWCAELRKHLGCGGAVEEDQLVLQGDQRDRAADWLGASKGVGKVTKG